MAHDKDLYPDLDSALNDAYRRNVEIGVAQPYETIDLDQEAPEALDASPQPIADEFMGIKFSAQRGEVVLPIQNLIVTLPEDPITVNGRYFGFEIDSERLVTAVNKANKSRTGYSWPPIDSMSLSLSNTLPPEMPAEVPDDIYHSKDQRLQLVLPKTIENPSMTVAELLKQAEGNLNLQIETGLLTAIGRMVRGDRAINSLKGVLFTLAPLSGVSVGLEVPQDLGPKVLEGGGTAIGILALAIASAYSYQRNYEAKTLKWAKQRVGDKEKFWRKQAIDEEAFSGPIIKIVPSPWGPTNN